MKTPHHKAFEYHYHFPTKDGVQMVSKNYIAILPGVDIEMLVKRWNLAAGKGRKYTLIGEIDLSTALNKRGTTGAMIANDWKIVPHMQFHGVEWEVSEVKENA